MSCKFENWNDIDRFNFCRVLRAIYELQKLHGIDWLDFSNRGIDSVRNWPIQTSMRWLTKHYHINNIPEQCKFLEMNECKQIMLVYYNDVRIERLLKKCMTRKCIIKKCKLYKKLKPNQTRLIIHLFNIIALFNLTKSYYYIINTHLNNNNEMKEQLHPLSFEISIGTFENYTFGNNNMFEWMNRISEQKCSELHTRITQIINNN